MAVTPGGNGYWLLDAGGNVHPFGNAVEYGSAAPYLGNEQAVGIAVANGGKGYWIASNNGSVFGFGDAPYFGSAFPYIGNEQVVAIVAAPGGNGYWILSNNGSVFGFGDAPYHGSAFPYLGNEQAVSMIASASSGYWILSNNGSVFGFGDAPYHGSAYGTTNGSPAVGIAADPSTNGYWITTANGSVSGYGNAVYTPSVDNESQTLASNSPTVAIAAGPDPAYPPGSTGYDISWPQCSGASGSFPQPPYTIAIVGVNDGWAGTDNPCLAAEAAWAGSMRQLYINLNSPGIVNDNGDLSGPAGNGSSCGNTCQAYNYGYNSAELSIAYATKEHALSSMWWLDIETGGGCTSSFPTEGNTLWSCDTTLNALTIKGALDALQAAGFTTGIYSTYLQWPAIAGSYSPGGPLWVPGAYTSDPASHCGSSYAFAGGTPRIVQEGAGYNNLVYDEDYAC
jgi:hypothetical protein